MEIGQNSGIRRVWRKNFSRFSSNCRLLFFFQKSKQIYTKIQSVIKRAFDGWLVVFNFEKLNFVDTPFLLAQFSLPQTRFVWFFFVPFCLIKISGTKKKKEIKKRQLTVDQKKRLILIWFESKGWPDRWLEPFEIETIRWIHTFIIPTPGYDFF